MLQADLLISLDRVQGALASLQHAEALANSNGRQFPFAEEDVLKVLPKDWYQSLIAPEAIDLRMGVLHEMVGDSEAALSYLEKALSQNPHRLRFDTWRLILQMLCYIRRKVPGCLSTVGQFARIENETVDDLPEVESRPEPDCLRWMLH